MITKILTVITLLLCATAVSYAIIIDRKRKAFFRDIKKDAEDNPDEIVSNKEFAKKKIKSISCSKSK